MEYNFDVVAGASALGGAILGALTAAIRYGRRDEKVTGAVALVGLKVDNLAEKMTLVCDELARRITVLENRYQYDGLYTQPRTGRPGSTPAE